MKNTMENRRILLTGGTGSFGRKFVSLTLAQKNPAKIIIFSRDEMKQWEMAQQFEHDPRIQFIIGDVRDKERLMQVVPGADYIVHAAATKIVPTAEYHPSECIKTNIIGAMNVIDAAVECNIARVVALSTDKASNPINLYGATKLASDKLFVASNREDENSTRFAVVRYGNVMGSRGSVIPFFVNQARHGVLPITHPSMTRFMISLEEGVGLVWKAFDDMQGGEIYVKKIPSMTITDIAKAVSPEAELKIIGIRPGEKIHEQMIGVEDAPFTYQYDGYYKILPALNNWSEDPKRIGKGTPVPEQFSYTSDNNSEWMTTDELQAWMKQNASQIGYI